MSAKLALEHMIATAVGNQPSFATTNQIMTGRTLVVKAVLKVANLAISIARGSAFYRQLGLEKLFCDVQGIRYHPLREEVQRNLSGQLALRCDVSS